MQCLNVLYLHFILPQVIDPKNALPFGLKKLLPGTLHIFKSGGGGFEYGFWEELLLPGFIGGRRKGTSSPQDQPKTK
jgi:hypothetical protein